MGVIGRWNTKDRHPLKLIIHNTPPWMSIRICLIKTLLRKKANGKNLSEGKRVQYYNLSR